LAALARAAPPPNSKDGVAVAPADDATREAENASKKAAHVEALKMRPRRRNTLGLKKP
jgi:hypothetical protein